METLTYFIDDIFHQELGAESFQLMTEKSFSGNEFNGLIVSGTMISNCIFENNIFSNCTFWSSMLENSLFINCLFLNCKFQFTQFTKCNFEDVSFENCMWGISKLQHAENLIETSLIGNISFASTLPHSSFEETKTLTLTEILISA